MSTDLLTHTQMFEKYKELGSNFAYPYFYELKKLGNILCFVGAKHSNDPSDSQFKTIKNHFSNFIKNTKGKKQLVLVEGGVTPVAKNETEAIRKYAEPGLTVHLGVGEDVQVLSPELPDDLEAGKLFEKYDKENVAVYYFANIVSQAQRFKIKENLDDYVSKYLGYYFYKPVWQGFDFSPQNLKILYQKVLGKEFNEADKEFVYESVKPSDSNISGASSDIRDEFILNKIEELWKENNLFIVYGLGHAIRLENALRNYSARR